MKPMSSLLVSFNSIEKPRYQTAGADKCSVAYTVLHKKKGGDLRDFEDRTTAWLDG